MSAIRILLDWMPIVILVAPALLVLASRRVHGYEKLGWTLVSLFLSWIGFAAFLVVHANRSPATRVE